MALLPTHDTLPASSQDALEMFDERYLALRLLQQPPTWADMLGDIIRTPSTSTKYPMSFLALKYLETKDYGGRFRTIAEKDCELEVVEYDDGVEIELLKLLTNSFSAARWADAPAGLIQAEAVFKNKSLATMLEANTALCGWDDLALFHDSHLANPGDAANSDTFDNLQATAKDPADVTDIAEEVALMMAVKDENGDKLDVKPTALGLPTEKFHAVANVLKQDIIANTAGTASIRNPYADGTLKLVHMPELTDVNDWYLFDEALIMKGAKPWVGAKLDIPKPGFDALGLRRFDENSDRFKETGKIAVSSHIYWGFKFLYPHAIRKVAGA